MSHKRTAIRTEEVNMSHLALAIIQQAIVDALDPTVSKRIRQDARKFLCEENWLRDELCKEARVHPREPELVLSLWSN